MCRWGLGLWPAVFLAGFVIDLSSHSPPLVALGTGAGLAGGASLSCWILQRGGFDHGFRRAKESFGHGHTVVDRDVHLLVFDFECAAEATLGDEQTGPLGRAEDEYRQAQAIKWHTPASQLKFERSADMAGFSFEMGLVGSEQMRPVWPRT